MENLNCLSNSQTNIFFKNIVLGQAIYLSISYLFLVFPLPCTVYKIIIIKITVIKIIVISIILIKKY